MPLDFEDKKYIEDGLLGCDEIEADLTEDAAIEEAFEPWKADAWLKGERKENVARMNPENMLAYLNYLDNVAYQSMRATNKIKAMKCVNLMREIKLAAARRFGEHSAVYSNIKNVIDGRVADINKTDEIRNLNQPKDAPENGVRNLFANIHEDINELDEEVEVHDTLNPLIWNEDDTLKPEVEEKVKNVVDIFVNILTEGKVRIKVKDIYLVGSNANYNYNESSDLDIHIIADESFDCDEKHLPLLYQAYKTLFNKKYEISFKGINVEVYVENEKDINNASTAVYSLTKGWIKKPNRDDIPEIDQEAVGQGVAEWTKRYEELLANPTIDGIEDYINDIYVLRTESIKNDGEFGIGNLTFKEIRRAGILDDLKDLKTELEAKEMSLESLNEDNKKKEDNHLGMEIVKRLKLKNP